MFFPSRRAGGACLLAVLSAACVGADGVRGPEGVAGASARVVVSPEPAGANCAAGGQRIDASVGAGPLTTAYVCDGATGAAGSDGVAGPAGAAANVTVTDEPAGPNCTAGGKKVTTSVGDAAPVISYVCNGAPGAEGAAGRDGADGTSAIAVQEPAGTHCANGGIKVTSAGSEQYVCNGANGTNGTNGTNGANGAPGRDGTNGTNGLDGTSGRDGADGRSVTSTVEPPGANCENGGVKLVSASGTDYVCNGSEGDLLSVNAGADQVALVGSPVTLAGSAASGVIGLRWSQFSGPSVVLDDPQSLTPRFTAPSYPTAAQRHLVFKLEASDGARIESDLVVVKLNRAPSAATVTLAPTSPRDTDDLTCTITQPSIDPDGDALTGAIVWTRNGAPFDGATVLSATTSMVSADVTADQDVFGCAAVSTDGQATTTGVEVTVRVRNQLVSCLAVKAATPAAANGLYELDPDGPGPLLPQSVYCDLAGGGWALLEVGRNAGTGLRTRNAVGTLTGPLANQPTSAKLSRAFAAGLLVAGERRLKFGRSDAGYLYTAGLDPSWLTAGLSANGANFGYMTVVTPNLISRSVGGTTYAGSRFAWPIDGMPAACLNSDGTTGECSAGLHVGTWAGSSANNSLDGAYFNHADCCNAGGAPYEVWGR